MTLMLASKFDIGQTVYSVLPNMPPGLVTDIRYSFLTNLLEYAVSFDALEESKWYVNFELTDIKPIP